MNIMSLQIVQAGSSYLQFPVAFVGDGSTTVLRFDLSKWPVAQSINGKPFDLTGVLPSNVVAYFSNGPSGYTTTVSALLDGSLLTITFGTAPPAPASSSEADFIAAEVLVQVHLGYSGV
jgi:hypothetical protein